MIIIDEAKALGDSKAYSVGTIKWNYPHKKPPPRGVKLNILQLGGIAIQGEWRDNAGYIGWQDLFKRDLEEEEEYFKYLEERGESVL